MCEETKIRFVPTSGKLREHYSAKRGFAIACRLSVPPSVTLVDYDHISWSVWDIRSQIAAEWLQIAQLRSQWRAYIGNHHRSFKWCHRWSPTTSPSPKMGVPYVPRYANGHISATGDPIHFMFCFMVGFSGSADRMALFPVTSNPSWWQAPILDNFEWPYLRHGSFDPLI